MSAVGRRSLVLSGTALAAVAIGFASGGACVREPSSSQPATAPTASAADPGEFSIQVGSVRHPALLVPGPHAIETWKKLFAERERTQRYPVIVGSRAEAANIDVVEHESPRRIIELATKLAPDPANSAASRSEPSASGDAEIAERLARAESEEAEFRGQVLAKTDFPPDVAPNHEFVGHMDLQTGTAHDQVVIALFPTTRGYETPAYLAFGGWNACPLPAEHVRLLKQWEEEYDAHVVTITRDVIELHVSRPPQSREAALALARVHYAYAPDDLDQGAATIGALGAKLMGANAWFFWWD